LSSTAGFFTAAHHQVGSQTYVNGVDLQALAGDQSRTQLCQLSLAKMGKQSKKVFRKNQLQDSVSEKLETLIIKMMPLRFMAQAWVSQGLG
jgi:hypothetical protein